MTIERALVAYDIGRAINPMLVRGQIMGGFAQGLGGAAILAVATLAGLAVALVLTRNRQNE